MNELVFAGGFFGPAKAASSFKELTPCHPSFWLLFSEDESIEGLSILFEFHADNTRPALFQVANRNPRFKRLLTQGLLKWSRFHVGGFAIQYQAAVPNNRSGFQLPVQAADLILRIFFEIPGSNRFH